MPIGRNVLVSGRSFNNPALNVNTVPDVAGAQQNALMTMLRGQQSQEAANRLATFAEDRGFERQKRAWYEEDRVLSQEFNAIKAGMMAKDPDEARAIYERLRPKGARKSGLGKPAPTFASVGERITIDGGPGQLKLTGPRAAVQKLFEDLEGNPQLLNEPEFFIAAAKAGITLERNKKAKWEPTTKAEALEIAAAKRSKKGDSPKVTSAKYRKEVARLAEVRERIRKGDKWDQIVKMISAQDPEAKNILGGGSDTKEEAIEKINDYERWLRNQIRQLETGETATTGENDPLGLFD